MRQNRTRAALVGGEVALAVVLLIASALLIRSFAALYRVNRGFETKNVVTMKVLLAGPKYESAAGVSQTVHSGLDRISAIPGVAAASATCCIPLQGQNTMSFEIAGRPQVADVYSQWAGWTTIWPDFFDVFRIRLKRGRDFNDHDNAGAPGVVIINETMARLYWKNKNPIGERIAVNRRVMKELKDDPVREIVGVVADVRDAGLAEEPRPEMYIPQAQLPAAANALVDEPLAWVVRTQTDPHSLAPVIQAQLRRATGLPVADVKLMNEVVSLSTTRQKFSMGVMGVFGGVALLLAAVGIYGLMAYTVQQRTQEIGIRLAIGAQERQVRGMLVLQGLTLALIGTIFGVAAAWALARSLESLLFGVKARDPVVFIVAPLMLGAVALLAVWIPARRALRANPVEALRCE
jgi:putative ABC transport system permease protein